MSFEAWGEPPEPPEHNGDRHWSWECNEGDHRNCDGMGFNGFDCECDVCHDLTPSETQILAIMDGTESWETIYTRENKRSRLAEKAIKSLKEKGLVEVGESGVLRKK